MRQRWRLRCGRWGVGVLGVAMTVGMLTWSAGSWDLIRCLFELMEQRAEIGDRRVVRCVC